MIFHCPLCHGAFSIEALVQDQAGRDLLCMVVKAGPLAPTLLSYLSLFRSEKRALAYDRALKLAQEVMELSGNQAHLAAAMAETAEALRQKREQGQAKPLKNHNYLRRVLENQIPPSPPFLKGGAFGTEDSHNPTLGKGGGNAGGISKRASALASLADWAGNDWLRLEIAAGLQALVAQNLKFSPAGDMITMNADVWHLALKKGCIIEHIDAPRIRSGFERLFPQIKEWPAPAQLLELMPRRLPQQSLPMPEPTEEDRRKGLEALSQLKEKMGIS